MKINGFIKDITGAKRVTDKRKAAFQKATS